MYDEIKRNDALSVHYYVTRSRPSPSRNAEFASDLKYIVGHSDNIIIFKVLQHD